MIKNPFSGAVLAVGYITAIASFLFYVPKQVDNVPTVLVPMMMLSLFVLSAAVMGYLFLGTPLELYFAGKRAEALRFFGTTVAFFAVITLALVLIVVFVV